MAFAITANFLLGTYQGSDSGGRPEPYPSPDRLYKACVAAAYNTFDDESGSKTYCDSQLPHRGFDGHIRVGVHDGKSTSESKEYIDARNSTLENLLPLFELSPVTVLFGGWDSTRSKNQLRIPSVLTGEMYGVLADQSDDDPAIHRAGARIDPVGASVSVAKKADREKIVGDSIDLSENTKNKFIGSGKGSIIGLVALLSMTNLMRLTSFAAKSTRVTP